MKPRGAAMYWGNSASLRMIFVAAPCQPFAALADARRANGELERLSEAEAAGNNPVGRTAARPRCAREVILFFFFICRSPVRFHKKSAGAPPGFIKNTGNAALFQRCPARDVSTAADVYFARTCSRTSASRSTRFHKKSAGAPRGFTKNLQKRHPVSS